MMGRAHKGREQAVEQTKWSGIAKGLVIAAAYCGAYLILRQMSFNQWFLPAGLRITCLLLVPYRYWPYLFAGDAAALLVLRGPTADDYSAQWAYLSPFLLILAISIVPLAVRKRLKNIDALTRGLPLVAGLAAVWSSCCNMALNYFLDGPVPLVTFENFTRYVVGDFLGILMVAIPCLLWLRRDRGIVSPRKLGLDAMFAVAAVGTMYAVAMVAPDSQHLFRQFLLLMMVLPAVVLTFIHGWNGAAIGIITVNLAISQTLTYTGIAGQHDETVFFVQEGLVIAAITLLTLGFRIAENYDKARQAGVAQTEALVVAQKSFLSSEQMLREHMLYMAQMQLSIDDERKDTAEWLKARGHAQAAMDLNARGMSSRRTFDERAPALYPLRIEQEGLYAVLHAESFTNFWGAGAEVYLGYKGQPKRLSVDLQLAAYRCICHAMAQLSESEPSEYRISMRVWHFGSRRGISVAVTADPTAQSRVTPAAVAASTILDARVKAYGGIAKREPHRVRVFLSEPVSQNAPVSLPLHAV
jgi:MASE1